MGLLSGQGGEQSQHGQQTTQLSPEAHVIQHLLMRFAMNQMAQGRPDYGQFLNAGGQLPPWPGMSVNPAEAMQFGVNVPHHPETNQLSIFDFLRGGSGGSAILPPALLPAGSGSGSLRELVTGSPGAQSLTELFGMQPAGSPQSISQLLGMR